MANYLNDNKDLQFYLDKAIDWEPLVRLTEYEYRAEDGFRSSEEAVGFYRDVLELVGKFSADEIAPKSAELDRLGVSLENGDVVFPGPLRKIFDEIAAMGLHGMCVPRELGGMNCPLLLYFMSAEVMARADVSVMAHHGFHGGIAMSMLMYSMLEGTTEFEVDPPRVTETRFADEVGEIVAGTAWGSMDITEPNAGSDMGALRCVGEQDEDGNWFVTGPKTFITSGHAKYHFVIARTERQTGGDSFDNLKKLSLFLVPTYEEDASGEKKWLATIDRLEEKLGHHGSATVSLSYDRTPAHLIGKRAEGFKLMLMLMNNARIGVGFEALGLCEAAHRLAREYAAERPSMGKMIDRHEMVADYLDEMETDIQGIRALAMYGAFHEEMAQKLRAKLMTLATDPDEKKQVQRDQRKHQKLSRAVTPLIKYFAAEKAVEMSRRGIQIHGGVGYTQEYGAEKLLRDAIVFPIYEGTSQIQALMAMKDNLMEVMREPQTFVKNASRAKALSLTSRDPLERRVAKVQSLAFGTIQNLMTRIVAGKLKQLDRRQPSAWLGALKDWDPKRDFGPAMLHAERLTELLANKAICEILLEQARAHPEREKVLIRFLERAEPRVRHLHQVITTTGARLLRQLQEMEVSA